MKFKLENSNNGYPQWPSDKKDDHYMFEFGNNFVDLRYSTQSIGILPALQIVVRFFQFLVHMDLGFHNNKHC